MKMAALIRLLPLVTLTFFASIQNHANGEISEKMLNAIDDANRNGPYLGIVIPNQFEMKPLLQHPSYKPSKIDAIDLGGSRFHFGTIANENVILVMTGLAMLNAGTTTQLLVSFFRVKGVVHYGIAGNANPYHNIGDVTIPKYWAHTGLWSWQRYGKGPKDELPFEGSGDYTRKYGYLKFADYATNVDGCSKNDNLLNNIWYQPEEIFPANGTSEERQHILWVPVDAKYLNIARQLKDLTLEQCINSTTCLPTTPRVKSTVFRGASANFYLDNAAYRTFLYDKFTVSPVDMESAAVALVCYQQNVPFITFRALSDLPGGGSAVSNEADTFSELAVKNSITVVVEFIKRVSTIASLPELVSEVEEVLFT